MSGVGIFSGLLSGGLLSVHHSLHCFHSRGLSGGSMYRYASTSLRSVIGCASLFCTIPVFYLLSVYSTSQLRKLHLRIYKYRVVSCVSDNKYH